MATFRLPSLRPAALFGVVLLSLPLAACASGNEEESPQTTGTGETDAEASLSVTPEGNGVKMLRLETDSPASEDQERLEGILISGSGGCLAVQPNGEPELLLFDQEASFADNPPRVSWGGSEAAVGEEFSVVATEVRVDDLQGVPEQCAQGTADTAWVINSQ